jgi:hypothetical protein
MDSWKSTVAASLIDNVRIVKSKPETPRFHSKLTAFTILEDLKIWALWGYCVNRNDCLLSGFDTMTAPASRGFAFEQFESRVLLAVDAFQNGSTLYVIGDGTDDHVQIDGDSDSMVVRADDGFEAEFTGVQSVRVILGEGDDTLDVGLDSGFDISGTLFVDVGQGNDAVQFANANASFVVVSLGTGDDDSLSADATQSDGWLVVLGDPTDTIETDSRTRLTNGAVTVVLPDTIRLRGGGDSLRRPSARFRRSPCVPGN